jgi:acylphosphatase
MTTANGRQLAADEQHAGVGRRASGVARLRIEIHGAVQEVGFRPFVYRLATELDPIGWVINDSCGVFLEVEGLRDRLR